MPNLEARLGEIAAGLEIVAARRLGDRDDALDATQETLSRLLERVRGGHVRTPEELTPLAYGIARHVIADVLRRRAREGALPADAPTGSASALDAIVRDDERLAVRAALSLLSASDRALLHRCFVDGERIGCIAKELGEPAERVRKRKSRALQRLGELLGAGNGRASHEFMPRAMGEA